MSNRSDSTTSTGGEEREPERRTGRSGVLQFLLRHPLGVLQAIGLTLLAVIVLQNLEPTSIDLLFWSIGGVPKLVLILVAMLIGAALWEILRRLLRRS